MKKTLSLLLALVMLFALCSVSALAEAAEETDALVVDTVILKEADDNMINNYTLLAVNPDAPFVDPDGNAVADVALNTVGAAALINWLLSEEGEELAANYGFAEYGEITGENPESIPLLNEDIILDMASLTNDFLSFSRPPEDGFGNPLSGAVISGDEIRIPSSYSGGVTLFYNRLPREISKDAPESDIDIPEKLSHLLPLLTASSLWLDDEPERAVYYADAYREGMAKVKRLSSSQIDRSVKDLLRWT